MRYQFLMQERDVYEYHDDSTQEGTSETNQEATPGTILDSQQVDLTVQASSSSTDTPPTEQRTVIELPPATHISEER